MFCDEVKIFFKAGNGGNSFYEVIKNNKRRYRVISGGKGGKGGGVILKVSKRVSSLSEVKRIKHFKASNGKNSNKVKKNGKCAYDIIVRIPSGTQVTSYDRKYVIYNFNQYNKERKILGGGKGGKVSSFLFFSKKKLKQYYTKGEIGREITLWLILKIFSNIGILGMPNIGKSTFLSNITLAKPKVDSYKFTTIVPQLGFVRNYIISEIPGICKNASLGYGLGIRFLKHLEKCKLIIHVIDSNCEKMIKNFTTIKKEISIYLSIVEKKEIIMLSKVDLVKYSIIIERKSKIEVYMNKEVTVYSSNVFHSYEKIINILYRKL